MGVGSILKRLSQFVWPHPRANLVKSILSIFPNATMTKYSILCLSSPNNMFAKSDKGRLCWAELLGLVNILKFGYVNSFPQGLFTLTNRSSQEIPLPNIFCSSQVKLFVRTQSILTSCSCLVLVSSEGKYVFCKNIVRWVSMRWSRKMFCKSSWRGDFWSRSLKLLLICTR